MFSVIFGYVKSESIEHLSINGCWTFRPKVYSDNRGNFFEWFQNSTFQDHSKSILNLSQANCSISEKGVIRGIHFAKYPPGQSKYVTCFSGSVFDVVIDLRKGSPTFGKWESVLIDSRDPLALFIPHGIGHAFMALENNTTFVYLCDQRYNPNNEFNISPFDPSIGISWPSKVTPVLSEKDRLGAKFEDLINEFPNFSDLQV